MIGRCGQLITIDQSGSPHAALLSFGEVIATDARTIRLGLPHDGISAEHLRRTPRALLSVVYGPVAYGVQGDVEPLPASSAVSQARFIMRVTGVTEDRPDGRHLTSGITYAPSRRTREVLADWEQSLAALVE